MHSNNMPSLRFQKHSFARMGRCFDAITIMSAHNEYTNASEIRSEADRHTKKNNDKTTRTLDSKPIVSIENKTNDGTRLICKICWSLKNCLYNFYLKPYGTIEIFYDGRNLSCASAVLQCFLLFKSGSPCAIFFSPCKEFIPATVGL